MKLVKQETDPNRNRVYIMEEHSDDPEIPVQTVWRKVGMLQESIVNDDPFYGRTRALRQGNVRDIVPVFSVLTHTKRTCKKIETAVHARLKREGYPCRFDETNCAGHGEWFKVPRDIAQSFIEHEYAKYQAQMGQDAKLFGAIVSKTPASKRMKKEKPVDLAIVSDLFSRI